MEDIIKASKIFGDQRQCLCSCFKLYYQHMGKSLKIAISEPYEKLEVYDRFDDDKEYELSDVKSTAELKRKVTAIKKDCYTARKKQRMNARDN